MNRFDILIEQVREYGEQCREEGARNERRVIAQRFLELDRKMNAHGGDAMIGMVSDLCGMEEEEVRKILEAVRPDMSPASWAIRYVAGDGRGGGTEDPGYALNRLFGALPPA